MLRPLPLVIALLGFASAAASAQEAATSPDIAAPAAEPSEPKPAVKKAAAAPAPRKISSTATTTAKKPATAPAPEPTATTTTSGQRSKRVAFVGKRDGAGEATPEVEEERPRSFWDRLFGRRKPKAAPPAAETPAPVATPKPTPRVRKPKPATTSGTSTTTTAPATTKAPKVKEPAAAENPAPTGAEDGVPKQAVKPAPAPPKVTKKTGSTAGTAPAATPARKAPVAPSSDADAEAQEKFRYEVAKEKALQDPEVQKLKEKADGATEDAEARKAQRAYNKALFGKMRSVDGSIKDRADRIEAAILKRLDASE